LFYDQVKRYDLVGVGEGGYTSATKTYYHDNVSTLNISHDTIEKAHLKIV